MSFSLSTGDFTKKLMVLTQAQIPKAAEAGLGKAGARLIRDAITEEPFAPKKTGHMRRQQMIEPYVDPDGRAQGVMVGFNTSYAAAVHEAPENTHWTLAGSGPKFLSSKLAKNGDRYMEIAAKEIERVVGK